MKNSKKALYSMLVATALGISITLIAVIPAHKKEQMLTKLRKNNALLVTINTQPIFTHGTAPDAINLKNAIVHDMESIRRDLETVRTTLREIMENQQEILSSMQ